VELHSLLLLYTTGSVFFLVFKELGPGRNSS
jgi:hypothetical protein